MFNSTTAGALLLTGGACPALRIRLGRLFAARTAWLWELFHNPNSTDCARPDAYPTDFKALGLEEDGRSMIVRVW
jgi:hypothetical protein